MRPEALVVSVSHEEDIDGLASASVLIRSVIVDRIFLTNYHVDKWRYVSREISDLCERYGDLEIYITDLNLSTEMINTLDNALRRCSKHVYWIDHHKWSIESIELTDSLGYFTRYGDKNFTATENLARYLGVSEDPVVKLLSELSRDSDFGYMRHVLTQPLTNIIRYTVYVSRNKFLLKRLVKKFSRGVLWDQEINDVWVEASRYIEKALSKALDSKRIIEDRKRILFIYSEPVLSSKIILSSISDLDYDLAVVVYSNGSVTISRNRDDIDCSLLARALGGGGHEHIAGAQIKKSLAKDFNESIKMILERIKDLL